jgi:hypothetical protein
MIEEESDYMKYRGKCREMCDEACAADPTLTLVRGHYYCPIWNVEEQHWWTVRQDNTIFDPSAKQYPSKGMGIYTLFDGTIECSECGKSFKEDDENASFDSNYAFCCGWCHGRFVGVY